jgi:hypothetical protein
MPRRLAALVAQTPGQDGDLAPERGADRDHEQPLCTL